MCPLFSAANWQQVRIDEVCRKHVYVCIHNGGQVLVGRKNKFARWFRGNFDERSARATLTKLELENQNALQQMGKDQLKSYLGCVENNGYCFYTGSEEYPHGFPIASYPEKEVLLGGRSRKNETIGQAAVREFKEETGYDLASLLYLFQAWRPPFSSFDVLYIQVMSDQLQTIAASFSVYQIQETRDAIGNRNFPNPPIDSDEISTISLKNSAQMTEYFRRDEDLDWFYKILTQGPFEIKKEDDSNYRPQRKSCESKEDGSEDFEHNGAIWRPRKGTGKIRTAYFIRDVRR